MGRAQGITRPPSHISKTVVPSTVHSGPPKWDRTIPASLTSLYWPPSGPWRTRAAGHRGRRELPGAGPLVYLSIRMWEDAGCACNGCFKTQATSAGCAQSSARRCSVHRAVVFYCRPSRDLMLRWLSSEEPLTARHRDGVTLCYVAHSRGHTGSRAGSRQIILRGPEVTRRRSVP